MQEPIRTNMKTIENKTTTISKSEGVSAKYGDLIVALLNKPLTKTVDLKAMRRDLRLLDIFEAEVDHFEVDDEAFNYIADLVDSSEWAIKHKDIVDFADYIDFLKG